MIDPPSTVTATPTSGRASNRCLLWISAAFLIVVVGMWAYFTPAGLLGKADAVGYAVCHRIQARSFLFPDGRPLPMCARCSGTFLGVLVGLLGPGLLLRRGRAASFPSPAILAALLAMSLLWAFDGANSFAHLLPYDRIPRLYPPTNFLRLLTGMLHGITMGSLVLPVVNATLWIDAINAPTLNRWWHLPVLYGIGAALMGLVLSGLGVFLYPLALLSALGALSMLAIVNLVVLLTLFRRENTARTLADALPLILVGAALAILMVGAIDAMRYAAFGTWAGFVPPMP